MGEREKAVAFLRREAAEIESQATPTPDDVTRVLAARDALDEAADAIERGDHLIRPEPTIPASEWINTPSVGH